MEKSKLEKVLEHLINDDEEAAKALLHDVFIEKAQEIHESLVAEDDLEDEDLGDFAGDESEEELMGDDEMSTNDEDDAADELVDDLADEEEGDEDLSTRIEDLEAQLEALTAEFEELAANEEGEDDGEDYDFDADDVDVDSEEDEGDDDVETDGDDDEDDDVETDDDDEEEEEMEESVDWDDDDFLALDEAAVDELTKVEAKNTHSEVGTGGKVAGNNTSAVVSKGVDQRAGGKGVQVKSTEHSGYDKEKAPTTQNGTGASNPKNTHTKSTEGRSKVEKSGSKGAKLNSDDGFGAEGKESPIGS